MPSLGMKNSNRRARDSTRKPQKNKTHEKIKTTRFGSQRHSYQAGLEGERAIQELLPQLKRLYDKEGRPMQGADFEYRAPHGRKFLFEVKTTFHDRHLGDKKNPITLTRHFPLKTRNGQWVNNKAHYVIFVTRGHSYIGKASKVRDYVQFNNARLAKIDVKEKGIVGSLVSIDDMESAGILFKFKNNKQEAKLVFNQFMKQEHKDALAKEQARRETFARMMLPRQQRPQNENMPQSRLFGRHGHVRLPPKRATGKN